jgi:DNA-directed RNA polymerase II subunit RPB2
MYLGYLINKLIKTTIGVIKRNERDNYMYKRVDTTGILLGNIFRDFYNQFRNNIRNSIDREYTLGGINKYDLVSEGNLKTVFNPNIISDGMYKSMKGNWGLTGDPSEQGIVQDVSRISYIAYVSHLRRVNTPIDRSIKLVAPHRLDAPQFGMMCPIESPDGSNIGLLKHLSATCEITLESNREEVLKCLIELHVISLEDVNPYSIQNSTKIILNNNWIGIHKNPRELYNKLIQFRREGILNAFISISWNIQENELLLFSDSGRCCRPLIVAEHFESMKYELDSWIKYVNGYTYDYTFDVKHKKPNTSIEYLDTYESNFALIAMKPNDIHKHHTHVELHPCLALSMYTNSICKS